MTTPLTAAQTDRIASHLQRGWKVPDSLVAELWQAYQTQAQDLAALRDLLTLCQEQRALLADWCHARTEHEREATRARADHHWRGISAYLATLALNVPSPGTAVAGRLAQLEVDRDQARERSAAYARDLLRAQAMLCQVAECLAQAADGTDVRDYARRLLALVAPAGEGLAELLAACRDLAAADAGGDGSPEDSIAIADVASRVAVAYRVYVASQAEEIVGR